MRVLLGIDRVLEDDVRLDGSRLGILTNDAARSSVSPSEPSRLSLVKGALPIVRVFSPEHGVSARAADGSRVDDSVDAATGLPVQSLYGDRFAPAPSDVADLDAVLFDVPDAGARFYTYLWTLTHLIDACSEAGVDIVVLDRPNPISGDLARCEGPMLDVERCSSFLGRLSSPITHGLTLGEFARLWVAERRPDAALTVVTMKGWSRGMTFRETGLPFVPPSPALQSVDAVALYPGLCLFEAFNVSVGRGTDLSFQCIAAPWLDPEAIAADIPDDVTAALKLSAAEVIPTIHPYEGRRCRALRLAVRDEQCVLPVRLGMHLVRAVAQVHPDKLNSAEYPTAANPSGRRHLELLLGREDVAQELPSATRDQIDAWTSVPVWSRRVSDYLLYS